MNQGSQGHLAETLRREGIVSIITLDDVKKAAPLAQALVDGGLRVFEVVLRTPSALDCVRAIREEVPNAIVGVGTVLSPQDMEASAVAGAAFAVSPGFSPTLLRAARSMEMPFLPAVGTAAETLQVIEAGYNIMKLFPAEQIGGPEFLKMLQGPFPKAEFCCTGGISMQRLAAYRAQSNVAAVGASFMTPKQAIETEAWSAITKLAAEAKARWEGQFEEAVHHAHRRVKLHPGQHFRPVLRTKPRHRVGAAR